MTGAQPSTNQHTTSSRARRRVAVGLLATAAFAGIPAAADATPPVHQPPSNSTYDLHVAAGDVPCGPITITYTDSERYTTFASGVTLVTGRLRAVVSSDVTGQSVSLNVSGPGKFHPDGSITGSGAWLLFGSEILAYTTGWLSIPDGDVNRVEVRGRRTDLCPLLGL